MLNGVSIFALYKGRYSSGQRGQTVNLLCELRRFESCSPHKKMRSFENAPKSYTLFGAFFMESKTIVNLITAVQIYLNNSFNAVGAIFDFKNKRI